MMPSHDRSDAEYDEWRESRICDHCGESIETRYWYPIEHEIRGDQIVVYSYCDEPCRSAADRQRSRAGDAGGSGGEVDVDRGDPDPDADDARS